MVTSQGRAWFCSYCFHFLPGGSVHSKPSPAAESAFAVGMTFVMVLLFALGVPSQLLADDEYRFERMWPTLQQPWHFKSPMGIAFDDNGYVYITEVGRHQVQKFTSDGTFVTSWGGEGSGTGQFIRPRSIAVDRSGFIYVVDTGNSRIQKFTPNGQFVSTWGGGGSEAGEFLVPKGIALDSNDYVYVVDSFNNRIQKFTTDGQFVAKWGSFGGGEEQFGNEAGAVAIDKNGVVYVADVSNYRIEKFTTDGQFLARWGSEGSRAGEFFGPMDTAIDQSGSVYVTDLSNHRIQKFSTEGRFLGQWGTPGSGDGEFSGPWGIAIDTSGFIYVTDSHNNRVQKFTPDGQFVTKWGGEGWGDEGDGEGEFHWPEGIAVDSDGYVYVVDTYNHRIQKFTGDGEFVSKWGGDGSEFEGSGTEDGDFRYPEGIAVDDHGYVYVADKWNSRIQKFTTAGQFVSAWGSFGGDDGQFDFPCGLQVDEEGYVYVADTENHRIQIFSTEGQYVAQWGAIGSGPGDLSVPHGLDADMSGRIYVCDTGHNRIQLFREVTLAANNKAIIVAGGGSYPGNNLWDATRMCANFAYRTLTYQGFTKDSIYYLTSDTDLDLDNNGQFDDVDGEATSANSSII